MPDVPLSVLRRHPRNGSVPTLAHLEGIPIGSRETYRIETPEGKVYYRYKCMCLQCKAVRGHLRKKAVRKPIPITAKTVQLARATAIKMNAARRVHGGGGAKPRTVEHDADLPIGSRDTVTTPYNRYACLCVDCKVARGQEPAPNYRPPSTRAWMTSEARGRFAEIRKTLKPARSPSGQAAAS